VAAQHQRLGVLDGLRGIAILLVVWYHVWQITFLPAPFEALEFIPETGFVGVDLFFFLSGFVIAYPFVRAQFAGRAAPSWRHFAYRRFMKIGPSYVLSIVVVLALGYTHFTSVAQAVRDLVTHLLFIHDWFAATYGSINGVLWSLAVEIQFYVLFPLLWWCFARNPWATAAGMTLTAVIYRWEAGHCCLRTYGPQLIDNLPGVLDIFAAGMLAAYLYVRLGERAADDRVRVLGLAVACAGTAGFVALLMNLYAFRTVDMWDTVWSIHNRSWFGLAFLAIAVGSLLAPRRWQQLLGNPVLLFFAAISYNLYLYHQALARGLVAVHVPPSVSADPRDDQHWQVTFTLVAFALATLQAAAVTFFFERPLLKANFSALTSRRRSESPLP
jgi:peptidoglycan/LPS O-acetylase OafA/YrhL